MITVTVDTPVSPYRDKLPGFSHDRRFRGEPLHPGQRDEGVEEGAQGRHCTLGSAHGTRVRTWKVFGYVRQKGDTRLRITLDMKSSRNARKDFTCSPLFDRIDFNTTLWFSKN